MKTNLRSRGAAWLTGCLWFVCVASTFGQTNTANTEAAIKLAQSYNEFGFKLFAELNKSRPGQNVFISPTSVALAISMLCEGAQGETEKEISRLLHADKSKSGDFAGANLQLLDLLTAPTEKVKLEIANSLWVEDSFAIKPDFISQLRNGYRAEVLSFDVANPQSATRMNKWGSDQTHGKISEIVQSPLDPLLRMVLLNAVYFKGEWQNTFDKKLTRETDFTLSNGNKIKHPRMSQTGSYHYLETETVRAVLLPYGEGDLGMYIFLPQKSTNSLKDLGGSLNFGGRIINYEPIRKTNETKVDLTSFLNTLDGKKWSEWMHNFRWQEGTVELPRFKLEAEYDLNQPLIELGMRKAFHAADFHQVSDEPLMVSKVVQKTLVEVNEEGTEAAAATAVFVTNGVKKEPFRMIVDRPFFVAISDRRAEALLFVGAIFDPR